MAQTIGPDQAKTVGDVHETQSAKGGQTGMKKFVLIFIASLLFAACEGATGRPTEKFSGAEWQAAPEQTRYKCVRDLLSSERLIGMSRVEVVTLLGPPSSELEVPNVIYVVKTGGARND